MITVVRIARERVKVIVDLDGEYGVFYLSDRAYTELRKALIAIPTETIGKAEPGPPPEPPRSIA